MSTFAKGIIAVIVVPGFLFGTVFVLLAMVLGAKLAYFVEACVTFGVLILTSLIWFITALGPMGPATAWVGIAEGTNITTATYAGHVYNLADYPGGAWKAPRAKLYMADLKGDDDTLAESLALTPVVQTTVNNAISLIPGLKSQVAPIVKGPVDLKPAKFTQTDVRMEPAVVKGKDSLIAVAKVVPSAPNAVTKLPEGAQSATIDKYLVNIGDQITGGQPVMAITLPNGNQAQLMSSLTGTVAALGPAPGSLIRPNVPMIIMDVSSLPGQPKPVLVAAVRVRGSLRTPAFFYLLVSTLLFILHLIGLSRLEKSRKPVPALS